MLPHHLSYHFQHITDFLHLWPSQCLPKLWSRCALCCVLVWLVIDQLYSSPSGLIHWHLGNNTIIIFWSYFTGNWASSPIACEITVKNMNKCIIWIHHGLSIETAQKEAKRMCAWMTETNFIAKFSWCFIPPWAYISGGACWNYAFDQHWLD